MANTLNFTSSITASSNYSEIIEQIVALEWNINLWKENEGKEIKNTKIINGIAQDILDVLEKGKTDKSYFFTGLKEVRRKWNDIQLSYVQKSNLDRGLSNALEKVMEFKIKAGEEIELQDIDEICSSKDLVARMKEALSKKAKDNSNNFDLEEMIKSLNEDNFTDERFWQALTGEENIRFTGTKEESKKAEIVPQKNNTTVVFPLNKRVALHYGTVDENTGEYTIKYTLYKNYSRKRLKADNIESNAPSKYRDYNLIGIDIDDKRIEEKGDNRLRDNLKKIFRSYNLKFVNIGNSIEEIPENFFKDSEIDVISLGENIKKIAEKAFYFSKCKKVIMRDNVTEIGIDAFKFSKLTSIDIPDSVKKIGFAAFEYCSDLESVKLGNNLESIGESTFYSCSKLTSIDIPDSVKKIGFAAFEYCSDLESVKLGNKLEVIGGCAFGSCYKLTSVDIPDSVKIIHDSAFYNCESLEDVKLGNKLEVIGGCAFGRCFKLTSVDIPDSVKEIARYAFDSHTHINMMHSKSKTPESNLQKPEEQEGQEPFED